MDDIEKLVDLRVITDTDDDDTVLLSYLRQAKYAILNKLYPYKADFEDITFPSRYEQKQIQIAAFLLNKRGADGELQHIENGIHRNYGSGDVPDDMLSDLVPMCGTFGG